MICLRCQREIPDSSLYCNLCGAPQNASTTRPPLSARRLARSASDQKIAGVCAGIANYFGVDSTLVRLLWVVLTIVPGAIVGGILAYVAAWLLMPEASPAEEFALAPRRRLTRSAADRKIAGVCGGLAEFFHVDSTAIRVLWVLLSILPGAVIGGILAYLLAWLIMPAPAEISPAVVSTPGSA